LVEGPFVQELVEGPFDQELVVESFYQEWEEAFTRRLVAEEVTFQVQVGEEVEVDS
jgi:hypothetical protein